MVAEYAGPQAHDEVRLPERRILSDAARRYHALGFKIIPVGLPNSAGDPKAPHNCCGLTTPYLQAPAQWGVIERWLDYPLWGLGIASGLHDSGYYLIEYDWDDALFCAWLRETPGVLAILQQTWVVQSGSGKIHLYFLSKTPVESGSHSIGLRHFVDIRGVGKNGNLPGYLIAPPSVHPSGGTYQTLYGAPETILRVQDAAVVYRAFLEAYTKQSWAAGSSGGREIKPPIGAVEVEELLHRLRHDKAISNKLRRTVLNESHWGEGEWRRSPVGSDSELDTAVMCGLVGAGWSDEDIERCYRTFAIGKNCYADAARPNHGTDYFQRTIKNAHYQIEQSRLGGAEAKGKNFRVSRATRAVGDRELAFTVWFETAVGDRIGHFGQLDFDNDRRFTQAVWRECHFVPDLLPQHRGANWATGFLAAFEGVVTNEDIPDDATQAGYLRSTILGILRSTAIRQAKPDTINALTLGWLDDGVVYVRGGLLINQIKALMHESKPESIWRTLKEVDASVHHADVKGHREIVWIIPKEKLDEA